MGSPKFAAGTLDILLIPGPEPSYKPSEQEINFIRQHVLSDEAQKKGTVVMTICTGIFVAEYAGILDGNEVTGPRGLLPDLRKKFPKSKWMEKRWQVNNGSRLWTSGKCKPDCQTNVRTVY